MTKARRRILEALQNKNLFTEALQLDVLSMLRKGLEPDQFIQKVNEESKWEDCLRCSGQPFCRLFMAVAYLEKGILFKAKSEVEEAIVGFRVRGSNWNQAMGYWMLGTILLEEGDYDSAGRSLQKALELLEPLLKEYRSSSNKSQARECQGHIQEIEKTIKSISPRLRKKTVQEGHPAPDHVEDLSTEGAAYLTIPWIPIYQHAEVEESVGEPAWIEHRSKLRTQLTELFIDGMCYTIRPVQQSTRQITLTAGKQYGWVKVNGYGMDTARPTPIQQGDYVLFCESDWPDQNEIVIVSKVSTFVVEDFSSYTIKRYSQQNHELLSETSFEDKYKPINITEDYRCMGVVLAVAKPKT